MAFLTLRDPDVDMSLQVTVKRRLLDSMTSPLVEGARVVAQVVPDYYDRRGRFTLHALDVRPVGVGALLAQIEHLRQLLAAEGVFDNARKRRLPFAPALVGLVCGRDSAAEHDVVVNATKRWPALAFEIRRVAVQGPQATAGLCQAITELDADPQVQVIVVARGGGSLEDLLAFSNETLIRTVSAARTPVVSAIGHESDTPLLDLVADVRASTPTDAAKRIVPDVDDERRGVQHVRQRLRHTMALLIDTEQSRLTALRARPGLADPADTLAAASERIDVARQRARQALAGRLTTAEGEIDHLRTRVGSLSPKSTLARGYAVVIDAQGRLITDAAQTAVGSSLQVMLGVGRLSAAVTQIDTDG
jgi:exodeoxyribonuclease VII large subunit